MIADVREMMAPEQEPEPITAEPINPA